MVGVDCSDYLCLVGSLVTDLSPRTDELVHHLDQIEICKFPAMLTEAELEATVSLGDTHLGSSTDNNGAITGSVHSSTVIGNFIFINSKSFNNLTNRAGRQNNIYHHYSTRPVEGKEIR